MVPPQKSIGKTGSTRGLARGASASDGRDVLLITPPLTAIGGIATHSGVLAAGMPELVIFDQWWPFRERAGSRALRTAGHVAALGRLSGVLLRRKPGLVHLQVSERGIRRDVVQARIARRAGWPVVAHLHSEFTGPGSTADLARLVAVVDAVVVLDEPMRDRVVHAAGRRGAPDVTVIRNPVHPAFVDAPPTPLPHGPRSEMRLFCPALIGELKNQTGVLEALDRSADHGVEARLVMAGRWDPSLTRAQRAAIERHPRAELVGVLRGAGLLREYDRADALVLFSRTEGEPMAVLEALSRELPVLATDVGGMRGLVPDVPPNVIVRPGDVAGLAAAVVDLGRRAPGDRRVPANRRRVLELRSPPGHVEQIRSVHARVRDGRG